MRASAETPESAWRVARREICVCPSPGVRERAVATEVGVAGARLPAAAGEGTGDRGEAGSGGVVGSESWPVVRKASNGYVMRGLLVVEPEGELGASAAGVPFSSISVAPVGAATTMVAETARSLLLAEVVLPTPPGIQPRPSSPEVSQISLPASPTPKSSPFMLPSSVEPSRSSLSELSS